MMTIETLLVDILEAAKRNDETAFNMAFENLERVAKRGRGLLTGEKIAGIMGFTTEAVYGGGTRPKRRQHIGTRNFGRNFAVMTVNPDDLNSWVFKVYGGKDEEIASYQLSK